MGPACGLDSGVSVVVEEDATVAVDAITDSSGEGSRGGRRESSYKKSGLETGKLAPGKGSEGRQHQLKGGDEEK
jgi:hypothetical protein